VEHGSTSSRAEPDDAVEHGGEEPTVTVTAERDHGDVVVRVSDDGPGIPDHELDVLSAGGESALEHGSGLGLWLVEWGTSALGADVAFDTDGDGTTASVTLPSADRNAR
jgi:signal transduction histidine kinase